VGPEVSHPGRTVDANILEINTNYPSICGNCSNSVFRALGIEQCDVFVCSAGNVGGPDYQVIVAGYLAIIGAFLVYFQHLRVGEELFGEGV